MTNLPIKTFFDFHALRGGKYINLIVANKLITLNLTEFKKVALPFELAGSDTQYQIINNEVTKVIE